MHTRTSEYQFTTEAPPGHYGYSYEQILYHKTKYLRCQQEMPTCSFWICDHNKEQIYGEVHWYLKGNKALSQSYAPFGSFNGCRLSSSIMADFLSMITALLFEQGQHQIEFNQPPSFYDYSHGWTSILKGSGFVERRQTNHHLVVDDSPLCEKMHKMEKRKLKKNHGFRFHMYPCSQLGIIYRFIEACRFDRGQGLSMSFEYLNKVVSQMPESFLLCTVNRDDIMAAAAIVVKVTSDCWYQFYPGHSKEFNRESPMVFLLSNLYERARQEGVRIIDLGTSEIDGRPIEGLQKFKSRVGGIQSSKSSYCKIIDQLHDQVSNEKPL